MITGYRTDISGNVLDYFELPTLPENTSTSLYVECAQSALPALYISSTQNAMNQIAALERSITLRMMREAFLGSTAVISDSASPFNGMTAAQAIDSVQTQIATLRASL